jgi:hypothetical protein
MWVQGFAKGARASLYAIVAILVLAFIWSVVRGLTTP